MRLVRFGWFYFGKMWKNMEKQLFFRADMAGLGKYCTGGYGRIGVYRPHGSGKLHQLLENPTCTPMPTIYSLQIRPVLVLP